MFSKKVNSSQKKIEQKGNNRKYLYKIPPWMKRNSNGQNIGRNEEKKGEDIDGRLSNLAAGTVNKYAGMFKAKVEQVAVSSEIVGHQKISKSGKLESLSSKVNDKLKELLVVEDNKKKNEKIKSHEKKNNFGIQKQAEILTTLPKNNLEENLLKSGNRSSGKPNQDSVSEKVKHLSKDQVGRVKSAESSSLKKFKVNLTMAENKKIIKNLKKAEEVENMSEIVKNLSDDEIVLGIMVKSSKEFKENLAENEKMVKNLLKKPNEDKSMSENVKNISKDETILSKRSDESEKLSILENKNIVKNLHKKTSDKIMFENVSKDMIFSKKSDESGFANNSEKKTDVKESAVRKIIAPKKIKQYVPEKNKYNMRNEHVMLKVSSNPIVLTSKEMLYNGVKNNKKNKINELNIKSKSINKRNVYVVNNKFKQLNQRDKENKRIGDVVKNLTLGKSNKGRKIVNVNLKDLMSKKPLYQSKHRLLKHNDKVKENIDKSIIKSTKSDNNLRQISFPQNSVDIDNRFSTRGYANKKLNKEDEWYKNIKNITPPFKLDIKPKIKQNRVPIFICKGPTFKIKKVNSSVVLKNPGEDLQNKKRPIFIPQPEIVDPTPNKVDDVECNKDRCTIETCLHQEKISVKKMLKPNSFVTFDFMCKLNQTIAQWANTINQLYKDVKFNRCRESIRPDAAQSLSVSLLMTDNKKQPVYICDNCSYLHKNPNIYQRVWKKMRNFANLIKTKESKVVEINTITGGKFVNETAENDKCLMKPKCENKKCIHGIIRKFGNDCPRPSYAEVLNNLLKKHFQYSAKCCGNTTK